jgi:uncharacterized membrane protein HdeD (DUF308 family)
MDLNGKYVGGSLLISLGAAYILNNAYLITSFFWCFVGIFFLMLGIYSVARAIAKREKTDVTSHFSTLFIGASILLFVFSIFRFTATMLFSTIFVSFGLSYILSGCFFRYSTRHIIAGFILLGVGVLLFIPFALNVSERVYSLIKDYALGVLLILLGIIIFFPGKKRQEKNNNGSTKIS